MMNKLLLTTLLSSLVVLCIATVQPKKNKTEVYAPIDFIKYNASNNEAMCDSAGIPRLGCMYTYNNNYVGNANVYLIHKNGTNWWRSEAKRRYPDLASYGGVASLEMAYNLLRADSAHIGDYHAYAFFIDKDELVRDANLLPEEEIQTRKEQKKRLPRMFKEEILDSTILYRAKEPHTIILYERKAGSNKWVKLMTHVHNTKTMSDGTVKEDYWELKYIYLKALEINVLNEMKALGPSKKRKKIQHF